MAEDYLLKSAEGTAHATANAMMDRIDVTTERERNARTDVLHVKFDVSHEGSTLNGERRARARFVGAMYRADGFVSRLSDDRMVIVGFRK